MSMSSKCVPENILKHMRPEDRRSIGQRTLDEIRADNAVKRESDLQKQCEQLLNQRGIAYLHLSPKAREKRGWPDLTFVYHGIPLAVELKTDVGRVSDDQKRVLCQMAANGWKVHVVRHLNHFIGILNDVRDVEAYAGMPSM